MIRRAVLSLSILAGVCWMVPLRAAEAPKKLSASAIRILMIETPDVQIPAEFRYAIYERLIERVREANTFQKVYREGDHAADSIPDLVTLHTKVEKFTEGSQTKREITTVAGATKVDVDVTVTSNDAKTLVDRKVSGKVRFFGENLGATNDLAKRITKVLTESF